MIDCLFQIAGTWHSSRKIILNLGLNKFRKEQVRILERLENSLTMMSLSQESMQKRVNKLRIHQILAVIFKNP